MNSKNEKKGALKIMKQLKHQGHRVLSFLLAAVMLLSSVTLPQASTQLEKSIPFEYGSGAITNLKEATVVGQTGSFQYNGKTAYPIQAKEKGDRYINFKNAGYYIGSDGKNHKIDMRAYIWAYQEDTDANEENKVHPFVWIDENKVVNIYSARMAGTYSDGYGTTYHNYPAASNGGVMIEYHFYDAGTENEVNFKGTLAFMDIDGIGNDENLVNEGISFESGLVEAIRTTSSVIVEKERNGRTWYQGTLDTEAIRGKDGLDQDDQKLTVKFNSSSVSPLRIAYRLNTCQANGRVDGYGYAFTNEFVNINYQIPKDYLPTLSSNKSSAQLIEEAGGEQNRYLNYGTQTNSTDAQKVLNKPALEVDGYTFDGWYTSDKFTDGSKWTGTESITAPLVLYGRYVNNEYTLNVKHVYVDANGNEKTLGEDQARKFKFGDEISSSPRTFQTDEPNTSYVVDTVSVDGGDKQKVTTSKVVHYNKGNKISHDVNVVYYYTLVDGTGKVAVYHRIEKTNEPLEGGKWDQVYTGLLGDDCHVSPVNVPGWKVTKVIIGGSADQTIAPEGVTAQYSQPTKEVYFYYEPDEDSAGLTIRYVYEGDPEVELTTPTDRVAGSIGTSVDADKIRKEKELKDLDSAFTGLEFLGVKDYGAGGSYDIVAPSDPKYTQLTNVTLTKEGKTITFVYRVNGTNIIVRHISKDSCNNGEILKTEDKVFKKTGSVFVASPETFKGYDLIGDSGNTTYTVTDADNGKTIYIDYYYQHEVHKVTVHHKDKDGNNFVWRNADTGESITYKDDVTSYHYGQEWVAKIKPHYGYDVVPTEEKSGVMGQEDVEVTYVYSPKPAKVIVHYVSIDNNKAEIITAKEYTDWVYGDNFTVYADNSKVTEADKIELAKWTLVDPSSGQISGRVNKFGDDAIEVYFYYTQADATVVVKHVWINDNGVKEDITTPQIYTGQINKTKWESAPWVGADSAGFVLKQEPTIKSGIMSEPYLTVEYVYVKKDALLTVNYLAKNAEGELVPFGLASVEKKVKYGDFVQLEPKTYPTYFQAQGYTVVEVRQTGATGWTASKSGNEITGFSGTVNNDRITVTFVYEPIELTVTSQYRDLANGPIQGPDASLAKDWVQYYPAHSKYTTHNAENLPPEFYGYEWTGRYPSNASGTLADQNVTVIYQYALKQSAYTVRYVDESGNKLANDKECNLKNGYQLYVFDQYNEYPISISGYNYKGLAKNSSPASGTLEELNSDGTTKTVITFVYERASAEVVARYLDTEGNTLEPSDTFTGVYQEAFTISPKVIAGWTLCSVEATGDVTINDANTVMGHYSTVKQTIKFIYTRTQTSVIVNHIDEETKMSLSTPDVITGKVGDPYKAEPVSLYGYSYVGPASNSAPIEGTMSDGVTIVTLMYRRNDATVTVYYVDNISGKNINADKNGKKIENPVVIKGRFKDLYDTQAAEIYGWKLVKVPENASGAMIDGNIDVVYRYEEYIPTVTARYVDIDDGHEVSEREVITGATGTRYETVAKDYDKDPDRYPELYGYTLVNIPSNAEGVFGEEDITVTYGYEKKTRTITVLFVEYVDGEMVEIASAETLANLTVGDEYTTHAKTIYGYELIDVPDNAKGRVTEKPITVIYVYQKTAAIVKVRYINEAMEDIAPSITIPGHIGDEYTTFAKTIRGYRVMIIPSNWKGIMSEKETYVNYVYKVATVTVTARYIDADTGEPLRNNITKVYPINSEYTTEALEFHGYTLTEMPSNASGIASNENGEIVTYYYTQRDAFVTAKYVTVVDGVEKQISTPVVQTGSVGATYRTAQKDIAGYKFDHVVGETTGTFVKGNTVVTYYYTAIEAKVIAQYVDTNGAVIAEEVVINGHVGDPYNTEQKEIEGYTFKTVTPNASGTMTEDTIYVVYTYQAKDALVITHYVDEQGNEIADTEYATYRRNARYQTTAKEIYGYTLTDTPANAFGNADKDVTTVTYVYRLLSATVEVRYEDENSETLAPSETIIGKVFDPYKTEAKDIDGYTLKQIPANASGTMTVETIVVIYRYVKDEPTVPSDDATVTVKYVDEFGKEIAPQEVITGKAGDDYKTEAKEIKGYTLTKTPDNAEGQMIEGNIDVTYVYKETEQKKDAKVTVRFVDEDGNDISDPTIIEGKVGDDYTTTPKDVDGYELVETPDNASGTITEEDTEVRYTYKKVDNTAKVIVKFVDKDGNEIAPSTIIKGEIGDDYEAKAIEIEGYKLTKTPDNAKGQMTKEDITVTFVYELTETEAENAKIIVKYVDESGTIISPSTIIEGKIGDDYEAKAKDIDGYELKTTPENAKGKIAKGIIVTFVYKEKAATKADAKVIVRYTENINGNEISSRTTIYGKVGDKYTTVPKKIDGYKVYTTPSNANGIMTEKDTIVTYIYEKEKTNDNNNNTDATISVKKSANSSTVTLGSDIKYTITVSVTGNDAKNVVIKDIFDDVLTTSTTTTTFVVNTKTKEIHSADCKHLNEVPTANLAKTTKSYATLTKSGYKAASDCSPKDNASTTSVWKKPNMVINKDSIKIVNSSNKSVNAKNIEFNNDGTMTITFDEIKKGETLVITYTASTKDESLVGKTITNSVSVNADNSSKKDTSASATVQVKNNGSGNNSSGNNGSGNNGSSNNGTGNNSTTNKPTTSTTTQTSTNNKPSGWVQTGDAYTIIFVVLAGIVVAGGLAFVFLKKKK